MPVLKDFRQTRTLTLPSYPESKVEIYDSLLVGELTDADMGAMKTFGDILPYICKVIKSWNFTSEDGKELPINTDSLKLLKSKDVQYIAEQIKEFADDEKKG